jgi:hypothetical protein
MYGTSSAENIDRTGRYKTGNQRFNSDFEIRNRFDARMFTRVGCKGVPADAGEWSIEILHVDSVTGIQTEGGKSLIWVVI